MLPTVQRVCMYIQQICELCDTKSPSHAHVIQEVFKVEDYRGRRQYFVIAHIVEEGVEEDGFEQSIRVAECGCVWDCSFGYPQTGSPETWFNGHHKLLAACSEAHRRVAESNYSGGVTLGFHSPKGDKGTIEFGGGLLQVSGVIVATTTGSIYNLGELEPTNVSELVPAELYQLAVVAAKNFNKR